MTPLENLCTEIQKSAKYRSLAPTVIQRVVQVELTKNPNAAAALKATKATLHQMAGAYFAGKPHYAEWERTLREAKEGKDDEVWKETLLSAMRHHASTAERLPILETIYTQTLEGLPPLTSVLDVACGLNPLASGWMPLAPNATYFAYDLYQDLAGFLNTYFGLVGLKGEARACDLLGDSPLPEAEFAFALKLLPVLEQERKGAGRDLLRRLPAPRVLVSFPTRTLGGRTKGMVQTYETYFREVAALEGWTYEQILFPQELCFLIRKSATP